MESAGSGCWWVLCTDVANRGHRSVPVLDDADHVNGLLSMDDVVVRGVPYGDIAAREIVETLHDMYARRPRAA
jgi:hypothetical protein